MAAIKKFKITLQPKFISTTKSPVRTKVVKSRANDDVPNKHQVARLSCPASFVRNKA